MTIPVPPSERRQRVLLADLEDHLDYEQARLAATPVTYRDRARDAAAAMTHWITRYAALIDGTPAS